jgi:hypothetical protein
MEGRTVSRARSAGSRTRDARLHDAGVVAEIRLASAEPRSRSWRRRGRKLWDRSEKPGASAGSLLVTDAALVVHAPAQFRGRLRIPWDSVRKAAIDDGGRWGYVSEVCRFAVHAGRADGSGHGALIGPLWSKVSSLMPPGCPVAELDPVPARPPNLALILEPGVPAPSVKDGNGNGAAKPKSLVGLLVCAEDPAAAQSALASRVAIADVDPADLDYLSDRRRA